VFKKKAKSVQEESKKEQEHKILVWFTLPQGLYPVLCQLAKISTNQDHKDQFTTIQILAISKNTLLSALSRNQPTEPFSKLQTQSRHHFICQKPTY